MAEIAERNVGLETSKAEQDAAEIISLVKKIKTDLELLDTDIRNHFNAISFSWADEFQARWKAVYDNGVPEVLEEMETSANNIRLAISAVSTYSNNG